MRVTAASLTVVAPTQGNTNEPNATGTSNGILNAVVTGMPRPFREPGIQAPDPGARRQQHSADPALGLQPGTADHRQRLAGRSDVRPRIWPPAR